MSEKSIQRKIAWTAEDRARHQAIREKYQRERPSLEELVATGDYSGPLPMSVYLDLRHAIRDLQLARERAGLSLSDVAKMSGIAVAALTSLERGANLESPMELLVRYAAAVGKQLSWTLRDLPPAGPPQQLVGS